MKISFGITAFNEIEEIKRLIPLLLSNKREEDEIVVLMDNRGPKELFDYLRDIDHIRLYSEKFPNNFSDWKNRLNSFCVGDFILQLDADEYIQEEFIRMLPTVLEGNNTVELFWLPRINTVEGLTQEHIMKWRWNVNEKGWINFPDLQGRLYRNIPEIKWEGKVHEKVVGYKQYASFPPVEEYCLYHPKKIKRQEKQNEMYDKM